MTTRDLTSYHDDPASSSAGSSRSASVGNPIGSTTELDDGRVTLGQPGTKATIEAGTRTPPSRGPRITGGSDSDDGPGPQVMGASTLTGNRVINSQGDDLGDIKEIMLDVRSGRVAYAVLATGGFLTMGEKLLALPWNALTLDADNKCFILDVDEKTLENAPGFDKDAWPTMADSQWASQVHSHFGVRPYWE